ncbi:MAG: ATP-binding protein [Oscillibacter sp.]|nr:ATP-binding protein [Oscillibacter sp.]
METELLQKIISEGRQLVSRIELIERDIPLDPTPNYVFVGLRQVGKSYMMYAKIKKLLREGTPYDSIVLINFDDERIDLRAHELDQILQAHQMMTTAEPIFFFDEIQNIDGWEHFARRLVNYKHRVFITGSNAKMLSKEIATTLGGRYLSQLILPYSFREFLQATGVSLSPDWKFGTQDTELDRHFQNYLYYGGLPDVTTIVTKRFWLNEMFSKILLSDIIVRNGIRSEKAIRLVIRRIAESVMHPLSVNRLVGMIKSTGQTISRNTMTDYLNYLNDSCLIFPIENYAAKFSERSLVRKYYFSDNGLLNIFLKTPDTLLLENLVAIELYRRYGNENIWFYNDNIEIDFMLPEKQMAIQVTWSINDETTHKRELNALEKFHNRFPDYHLLLITRYATTSKTTLSDGTIVETFPIVKWLLLQ